VRTPIMASSGCNRDAPAHTATHSSTAPLPIHELAPAHTTTHGKRKCVATTPLPVHSSQRGSGHAQVWQGGKTRAHDNHGLHLFCLGRAAVVVLLCFQLRLVRRQAWITPPKAAAPPSTPPSPSSGAIPRYSFKVGGWHLKNVAVAPPYAQQRKFHTSTPMR